MKRHEWWREQYNADPYLRGLGEDILKVRTDDVLANNWYIGDDLKLGMLSPRTEGDFWIISWTHLLEEWGIHGGLPGGPDLSKMPRLDWPGLDSVVAPFALSRTTHPNVLVKYGDRVHLNGALTDGRFRIGSASSYDDPSLNVAIRDDELSMTVYRRSRLYALLYDTYGNVLAPAGPTNGFRQETLKAPTNYYVYCLGVERSLRMFGDFEADAAMIIHEPVRFIRRLGEAVRRVLGSDWTWFAGPIRYVDPLRAPAGPLDIVRSKHFLFAYQKEYRIVWLPLRPVAKLDPIFLVVDPAVGDCASLVELTPASSSSV